MSTPMPLPVDVLLGQLHEVGKRRVCVHQGIEENMRMAGKLWADVWELDVHEQGLLTALQALGATIEYQEGEES